MLEGSDSLSTRRSRLWWEFGLAGLSCHRDEISRTPVGEILSRRRFFQAQVFSSKTYLYMPSLFLLRSCSAGPSLRAVEHTHDGRRTRTPVSPDVYMQKTRVVLAFMRLCFSSQRSFVISRPANRGLPLTVVAHYPLASTNPFRAAVSLTTVASTPLSPWLVLASTLENDGSVGTPQPEPRCGRNLIVPKQHRVSHATHGRRRHDTWKT